MSVWLPSVLFLLYLTTSTLSQAVLILYIQKKFNSLHPFKKKFPLQPHYIFIISLQPYPWVKKHIISINVFTKDSIFQAYN